MKASLGLSIISVLWIIAGLIGLLAPEQALSMFGLGAPSAAVISQRDGGVVLMGIGIISWLARDATGPTLRGIVLGNLFILAADAAVNLWELAAGIAPFGPWVASFALPVLFIPSLAGGLRDAGRQRP
jgi:hypothetical protein